MIRSGIVDEIVMLHCLLGDLVLGVQMPLYHSSSRPSDLVTVFCSLDKASDDVAFLGRQVHNVSTDEAKADQAHTLPRNHAAECLRYELVEEVHLKPVCALRILCFFDGSIIYDTSSTGLSCKPDVSNMAQDRLYESLSYEIRRTDNQY